jgi:hypothetical protein
MALAALMTPWANLHGGFILGLALIGPFAMEAVIAAAPERRTVAAKGWAPFAVASLAASLVTPFAVSGLLFPIKLLGLSSLAGVSEWKPTDFSRIGPLEISFIAALYVLLWRGVRIAPRRLALLLFLLQMSLQHSGHQMVLAVIGPMLLAQPLGNSIGGQRNPSQHTAGPGWALGTAVAVVILAGVRLAWPVIRDDGVTSPITALQHVPPALRQKAVLNDYGMGGYLIFEGVRPFIDGRTDMYGDAFTRAFMRVERPDPAALDSLIPRWQLCWTLLNAQDPLAQLMDGRPGWRRLYADRYAVIHVREECW